MAETGIRRNFWIHGDNVQKLEKLKDFYGSNYSAVVNMLIAERHLTIFNPAPQETITEDE